MDHALKFPLLLILLLFHLDFTTVSANSISHTNFGHCEKIVKKWASSSSQDLQVNENKHNLRDLLFFLHVPRTGGRTYFHCFLKKLYSRSLECPRSYDELRFDPSTRNCRLLATHDDYSFISKLPKEKTSVVTILRDPSERVLSTYEFSIEVAARFLVHPNLTSATRMAGRIRSKNKQVSTLDIWPWKYLVPWMREDLFARRDARKIGISNHQRWNNSYDMEDFVMPLHEYINDPVARDIIHNGATFQVAGLTNNSYLPESHEVRHCVQRYQSLGAYVLEVAKRRLDDMLYVGLTEQHRESATLFGDVVGSQVISQLIELSSQMEHAYFNKTEQRPSFSTSSHGSSHHGNSSINKKESGLASLIHQETNETMTVEDLMETYETCISTLRKSHATRRAASLKHISPANFSKEARRQILDTVLQQIISLNRLDVELYKHAQEIFAKQQKYASQKMVASGMRESILYYSDGVPLWKVISLATSLFLLVFLVFLFVNARRRTMKIKV
ncbi:hypothetical protein RJ641_033086 [Dillenia turbinata]|uniref:Sulfotransferase domain-containing protein n=1 Tax=Dillenia turbinata TaxID=194707 RepID=A0AAN8VUM3_9MAGN